MMPVNDLESPERAEAAVCEAFAEEYESKKATS
jgi:hypothetical protein